MGQNIFLKMEKMGDGCMGEMSPGLMGEMSPGLEPKLWN